MCSDGSPLPAPLWLTAHISLLLVFAACIPWHLPLKVKCYFRRKILGKMKTYSPQVQQSCSSSADSRGVQTAPAHL
ncbi:hypothetical protein AMECASPLE_021756 [Ameca splendens]|uniref:Uncharacterized protein n=1 Tax=Ameca splendens TaxID=208324 RepID=A0ABV1A086_9TELE